MKFSVLMSVYAKEKAVYLDQALKSIVKQTLLPDEIVIVEDGNLTRELDEVICRYINNYKGLFKIVCLNEPSGLGTALNTGLLQCSFDIVARMDSDDICLPDRFKKQANILENHDDIALIGSWIGEFFDDPCHMVSVKSLPSASEDIVKYAKSRNPINHVTVMFRKKAVLEAGNYLPSEGSEDYYLWVRMLLKKYKLINMPEILVLVRANSDMFKRRGGAGYVKSQVRLEKKFLSLKFISIGEFMRNVFVRASIGLLPSRLREKIYVRLLRGGSGLKDKIEVKCHEGRYEISG